MRNETVLAPAPAPVKCGYNRSGAVTWILSHIIKYPVWFVVFLAMSVVSIYAQNWSYVVLGRMLDHLKLNMDSLSFAFSAALYLLVLAGGGIAYWLSTLIILRLRLRVEKD